MPQQQRRQPEPTTEAGWFGLARAGSVKFKVPGHGARGAGRTGRSRSAASTATCRCASRPTAARCRATASSASCTPGEGITIYPIQSPALTAFDDQPERWLDVRWDIDEPGAPALPGARIAVTAINEPGSLAQIAQVIGENDGNIDNVRMARRRPTSPR